MPNFSKTSYTLTAKKLLTHDVFELTFHAAEAIAPLPGSYVMFFLTNTNLKRSYSIAWHDRNNFTFIIKRIPLENGGKGGSMEICDLEIGATVEGMGPLGHFTLSEEITTKCFIGTGTGFAPLYYQMRALRQQDTATPLALIYGVRGSEDTFYHEEIANILENTPYELKYYLSREEKMGFEKGYVTDWITAEHIAPYSEFYVCGSPAMVHSAREKLTELGVVKERIKFEQF